MVMPLKASSPDADTSVSGSGSVSVLPVFTAPCPCDTQCLSVPLFSDLTGEGEEEGSCTTMAGRLDTRDNPFSVDSATVEGAVVVGVPGCNALSLRISSLRRDLAKKDGGGSAVAGVLLDEDKPWLLTR
jgi:hypothetical protein